VNYQNLLVESAAGVARVTVNRPEKLNALNQQTLIELGQAFAALKADTAVRAVILTGSGPKAFVAGADIAELAGLKPTDARDASLLGQRVMSAIENLGKPVIAAINGFALGGGLELAMACSIRVASDKARLGLPEITLGLMPGFGGTQRALRLVGKAAALELTLLGAPIDAQRAYALGLVTQVVPADQLDTAVSAMATKLAQSAPLALRGILDAINRAGDGPIEQGIEYESTAFGLLFATQDMREGTTAFLEKRAAQFTGN
jgi:enoyl-CoA hydratase